MSKIYSIISHMQLLLKIENGCIFQNFDIHKFVALSISEINNIFLKNHPLVFVRQWSKTSI